MARAFIAVAGAYALALLAAFGVAARLEGEDPLWIAVWADVVATCVVFAASFAFRNTSFYDPYWSVAPIAIALYWIAAPGSAGDPLRQGLVLGFIAWWGLRLTWNWARTWGGLGHEDWRYVQLRQPSGRAYWLLSFAGLHMMPTLIVLGGLLPVYVALHAGARPLGWLDALAALVTAGAILCEQTADRQLLRFRRSAPGPGALLDTGLWGRSRHPNYLGEIGFWWGLYLFGLAAAPGWWWTGIGAAGITVMFLVVSLPMIEARMRERRPGYAEHQRRVPLLIPRMGAGGVE